MLNSPKISPSHLTSLKTFVHDVNPHAHTKTWIHTFTAFSASESAVNGLFKSAGEPVGGATAQYCFNVLSEH